MIDQALIDQYQRHGAVCIRQLFGHDEIATLRAGIELNLSSLSPRAIVASGADDPGRFMLTPGNTVYFFYSTPSSDGHQPLITAWFRYDPALTDIYGLT